MSVQANPEIQGSIVVVMDVFMDKIILSQTVNGSQLSMVVQLKTPCPGLNKNKYINSIAIIDSITDTSRHTH